MKRILWLLVIVVMAPIAFAQRTAPPTIAVSPLSIGETFTMPSTTLGETRRINVYLPPGYADAPAGRFPVLYMPDGGLAEDFIHVAGLVQVSVGNGTMRPFVLVGIENTQRRRDLSGPTENPEDRKIAPQVGGSATFRRFLRAELMPVITSRYRTTAETAIVGESLAGFFVVETLFLEPDLFDTYIAFDPSLWWNSGALVTQAPERLRSWKAGSKRLYLAASRDGDRDDAISRMVEVLRQSAPRELTWHSEVMPSETHATIYHPAALMAFRYLFKPQAGDGKQQR